MQLVGVCLISFLLYTVLACLVSHTLMVPSSLLLVARREVWHGAVVRRGDAPGMDWVECVDQGQV